MKESILFWPVNMEGRTIHILDETEIPRKVTYIKAKDFRQVIDAVVSMKTRAFGQFLAVCYSFILESDNFKAKDTEAQLSHLKQVAESFNKSRPTFPFSEVTGMLLGMAAKCAGSPSFNAAFTGAVRGMLAGIRNQRYDRAGRAADLLKNGDNILTHCHVSGEMSLIGEFCRKSGKKVKFFATETRPYFQGARLTAWELKRQGLDVTLVPDSAVAGLMSEGKIDCVIVGSDRSAKNGDFANKIGTYQIALLAKHFNIPFYVLTQPSDKLKSGDEIPIEIRKDEEILNFEGKRLAPEGASAYYPGFDVVPHTLVTKHIAISTS